MPLCEARLAAAARWILRAAINARAVTDSPQPNTTPQMEAASAEFDAALDEGRRLGYSEEWLREFTQSETLRVLGADR